jgi:hypothetical protein
MEVKENRGTRNLNKLSAYANAVTGFEIPLKNMERAKEFYETILNIKMVDTGGEKEGEEMVLFPRFRMCRWADPIWFRVV